MSLNLNELVIGVKSAGEIASGIVCRLFQANMRNIFMMETKVPLAVRRMVSFSETLYDDKITIEGVEGKKVESSEEIHKAWNENQYQNYEAPCCH
jgi:xanthine dehydrogenase accessory factor